MQRARSRGPTGVSASEAVGREGDFLTWFLHARAQGTRGQVQGGEIGHRSVLPGGARGDHGGGREGARAPQRMPFYALPLDLPAAPLFQDAMEKNAIPQVPIGRSFASSTARRSTRRCGAVDERSSSRACLDFSSCTTSASPKTTFSWRRTPPSLGSRATNLRLSDHVPVPEGRGRATRAVRVRPRRERVARR